MILKILFILYTDEVKDDVNDEVNDDIVDR